MGNELIFTFGHMVHPSKLPDFIQMIKDGESISWDDLEFLLVEQCALSDSVYLPTSLHIRPWQKAGDFPSLLRGNVEFEKSCKPVRKQITKKVSKKGCDFRSIRREIWDTSSRYWLKFEISWSVDVFIGRFSMTEEWFDYII